MNNEFLKHYFRKQAALMGAPVGAVDTMASKKPMPPKPVAPKVPRVGEGDLNDRVPQPGAKGPGNKPSVE